MNQKSNLFCRSAAVLILCLAGSSLLLQAQDPEITFRKYKTAGGVEYGIWGEPSETPAPILLNLSGTIEGTLGKPYFRQAGNVLAEKGYLSVSIDIPCHGTQTGKGKPSGIGGWALRAEKGEDIVEECNSRLSEVLTHLIKTGVAAPEKIAICGTSRGGFLALHFAAHDPRVKCAAAFAPISDPAVVSEFKGRESLPLVKHWSLASRANQLAGRAVWIVIGDQDERVSTQKSIELAQSITAASIAAKVDSRVALHVMPEPRGHTTPKGAASTAAQWIHEQIGNSAGG